MLPGLRAVGAVRPLEYLKPNMAWARFLRVRLLLGFAMDGMGLKGLPSRMDMSWKARLKMGEREGQRRKWVR